jgi:hypothetical protein
LTVGGSKEEFLLKLQHLTKDHTFAVIQNKEECSVDVPWSGSDSLVIKLGNRLTPSRDLSGQEPHPKRFRTTVGH